MHLPAILGLVLSIAAAAPVHAETALERVLAMVADNPDLAGGTVFINLASHAPGTDGSDVVDSSVQYVQPPTGMGENPSGPRALQIATMALGATNTGLIRVLSSMAPVPGEAAVPIIAANGAITHSPISAPIHVASDLPLSAESTLSTQAIGSMNSGIVLISILTRGDQ